MMEECGIKVTRNPAEMGKLMKSVLELASTEHRRGRLTNVHARSRCDRRGLPPVGGERVGRRHSKARQRQGARQAQGPAGRPEGARGGAGAARGRAAPPRSPDRAPAQDPGPLRLPLGRRTSSRSRARCSSRRPRSTRSRPSITTSTSSRKARRRRPRSRCACAIRCRASSPAGARCSKRSRRGLGDGVRVIPAPCVGRCEQAPVAVVGQQPGRATRRRKRSSPRLPQARTSSARSAITSTTRDIAPHGGYTLAADCLGGKRDVEDGHQDHGELGPARPRRRGLSRPGASGASCAPSRRRASWRSTSTKASPARSRTATTSSAIRTASSKAC